MHRHIYLLFFHCSSESLLLSYFKVSFSASQSKNVHVCGCVRALTLVFPLQNRAQAATELLQELNSDVSGNFVEEVGIICALTWCYRNVVRFNVTVSEVKNENSCSVSV